MKKSRLPGKLRQYFEPARVVNLCFVVVLVCSTVLTWREVMVLENAYVSNQRNMLVNVSNALDQQMQVGVDRLLFFRNGMQEALRTPLAFAVLHNIQSEFERQRAHAQWQIALDARRTLPLYGVSDSFVAQNEQLNRDNRLLHNELTAAMELGYLYRLSANAAMLPRRAYYVSRAGFFVATQALGSEQEIIPTYYHLLMRSWFQGQSEGENRQRGVRWFTDRAYHSLESQSLITASIPLDYQQYWFGVLMMSFPLSAINQLLNDARREGERGEYQLYDSHFRMLTSTLAPGATEQTFTPRQRAQLLASMANETAGGVRFGKRFVSWQKLRQFDGTLLRVHVLHDGIKGDFGRITVALVLMWVLFTTMLLLSWGVIRRMVRNMLTMQHTLQWQAWYDPLTRLYNRRFLFGRAKALSAQCKEQQLPFSVIQIDLDHFKAINDRYGHQAGDRVLMVAAGLINSAISPHDVAGRVGGEEFCIVLPGCSLAQAKDIAERIRLRIYGKQMLVQKHETVRISASLGVSSAQESNNYDFEYLQSVADSHLYRAKKRGRNQVCAEDVVPKT